MKKIFVSWNLDIGTFKNSGTEKFEVLTCKEAKDLCEKKILPTFPLSHWRHFKIENIEELKNEY